MVTHFYRSDIITKDKYWGKLLCTFPLTYSSVVHDVIFFPRYHLAQRDWCKHIISVVWAFSVKSVNHNKTVLQPGGCLFLQFICSASESSTSVFTCSAVVNTSCCCSIPKLFFYYAETSYQHSGVFYPSVYEPILKAAPSQDSCETGPNIQHLTCTVEQLITNSVKCVSSVRIKSSKKKKLQSTNYSVIFKWPWRVSPLHQPLFPHTITTQSDRIFLLCLAWAWCWDEAVSMAFWAAVAHTM